MLVHITGGVVIKRRGGFITSTQNSNQEGRPSVCNRAHQELGLQRKAHMFLREHTPPFCVWLRV